MRVILSLVNVLLFLLVASSCKEEQTHVMKIDLSQLKTDIRYSEFVDSVSYFTLHTNDSCIVSEVGRLYIDGDTLAVEISSEEDDYDSHFQILHIKN